MSAPCSVYWNCVRRCAAADVDVLRRLQEQARALDLVELAAQPRDDLVGIRCALIARLQGDEHAAVVRVGLPVPPMNIADVVDRGIASARSRPSCQLVSHHFGKRDVLRGFGYAGEQPDILLREEALRDDHEQIARESDRGEEYAERDEAMTATPRRGRAR